MKKIIQGNKIAQLVVNSLILMLLIAACDACEIEIDTHFLPQGVVGQPYNAYFESSNGGEDWFIMSGELPPGLSMNNSGHIRGIPTLAGLYSFTVGVIEYDCDGEDRDATAYAGFTITIVD
jgi:hypothetical protein